MQPASAPLPSPPESLVEALRARRVVAIIGSGLSLRSGYPTWQQLLLRLAYQAQQDFPERRAELTPALAALTSPGGSFPRVADALASVLGPNLNARIVSALKQDRDIELVKADTSTPHTAPYLRSMPPRPRDRRWTRAHELLTRDLGLRAIVTTNYDMLLEHAGPPGQRVASFTWSNPNVTSWLRKRDLFILKLHGDIDNENDLVLTERQYDAVMKQGTVQDTLRSLFSTSVPLWIGYGHSDPDLNRTVNELSALGLTPGYAIATPDELLLRTRLGAAGFEIITLQDYALLDAYLLSLVTAQATEPPKVYVRSGHLQQGSITHRPTGTLVDMCKSAVKRIIADEPDLVAQVEAIYFASMGIIPSGEDSVAPSHVPFEVRELKNDLGKTAFPNIKGQGYKIFAGTSDAGAVALYEAYKDLKAGRYRTVLVVAGEQMQSRHTAATSSRERAEADGEICKRAIRAVLDYEDRKYGLTMRHLGDMLMDNIAWRIQASKEEVRNHIRISTAHKYQQALLYPQALQPAKELDEPKRYMTAEVYDRPSEWDTEYFKLNDLCQNASGATAVLLSVVPPESGDRTELAGMGEGHTNPSLQLRAGPLGAFAAIRRAYRDLCSRQSIDPDKLWDLDGIYGVFHDAFPTIELAFLAELCPPSDNRWSDVLERFLGAWGNLLGGLNAGGHALGNSGLFQIAKAFHILNPASGFASERGGRETYIDPQRSLSTGDRRFHYRHGDDASGVVGEHVKALLVTSVGSAITNVYCSLLINHARLERTKLLKTAGAETIQERFRKPQVDRRTRAVVRESAPRGLVEARTKGDLGWVLAVRVHVPPLDASAADSDEHYPLVFAHYDAADLPGCGHTVALSPSPRDVVGRGDPHNRETYRASDPSPQPVLRSGRAQPNFDYVIHGNPNLDDRLPPDLHDKYRSGS